ncbi:hypothetical protein ACWEDZ_16960 [Streptomyces sp. NPDC005047]
MPEVIGRSPAVEGEEGGARIPRSRRPVDGRHPAGTYGDEHGTHPFLR